MLPFRSLVRQFPRVAPTAAATSLLSTPTVNASRKTLRCFTLVRQLGEPTLSTMSVGLSSRQALSFFKKAVPSPTTSAKLSQSRTFLNFLRRSGTRLREAAEAQPENAEIQDQYFAYLAQKNPMMLIERFESGLYALSKEAKKMYIAALVQTNQIERLNLQEFPSKTGTIDVNALMRGTKEHPVFVTYSEPSTRQMLWRLLRSVLGIYLLIVGFMLIVDSQGIGKAMGFQKKNTFAPDDRPKKTFDDVKGADEAKEDLVEIVDYLKHPEKFSRLGGKLPAGLLMVGPPGTGKTLLARAVSGEADVPFFYAAGSEFDEMFVGVGAKRVRELFAAARKAAPCIVFIDEIDAVGAKRSARDHQHARMTLNQLLSEIDGYNPSEGVILIGATNDPESLDPALTRPGRFDKIVKVDNPTIKGRKDILELYAKNIPLGEDVDMDKIARGTTGFSGASLANLINQAALAAASRGAEAVNHSDLEGARDNILMGKERKSYMMLDKEKKNTAYHEAGHTIVAYFTKETMPLHKVTILPRGMALGMVSVGRRARSSLSVLTDCAALQTQQLPDHDRVSENYAEMLAQLDILLGGRVAEEMLNGREGVTGGMYCLLIHDILFDSTTCGFFVLFGSSPYLFLVQVHPMIS